MASRKKLFVVGDSISMHYGPHLKEYIKPRFSYARKTTLTRLPENLDKPSLSNANGGDSDMVLAYLEYILSRKKKKIDVLLLNCGLHDIKTDPVTKRKQVPLPQYKKNLAAICALLKKNKLKTIWVRTTPVNDTQHNNRANMGFHRYHKDELAYNRAADAIMNKAKIPSIDLNTFTGSLGSDIFADHIHYPEHIQKLQAAFIAGCLSRIFP